MEINKRLNWATTAFAMLMVAGMAQYVLAASVVPREWNVHSNFKAGAYLEDFEGSKPAWVDANSSLETANSHADNYPSRVNTWFSSNAKVLQLDSGNTVITNEMLYDDSTSVSLESDHPVYVDVRVKFQLMGEALENLSGAKLAIYASDATKLQVVHKNGTNEYAGVDLDSKWHQLTVVLASAGKFDVYLDGTKKNGSALSFIEAANDGKLNSVAFMGKGQIDELYVSHGNPDYSGTMGAIPGDVTSEGIDGEAKVNNWLAHKVYDNELPLGTTFDGITQTDLNNAYLLNELAVDNGEAQVQQAALGIKALEWTDTDELKVSVYLKVDDVEKVGKINGRIQLQGKVNKHDVAFTNIGGAITPRLLDFASGVATYTFTLPENSTYRFFRPAIVE